MTKEKANIQSILFGCPHCGYKIQVTKEICERLGVCPQCREKLTLAPWDMLLNKLNQESQDQEVQVYRKGLSPESKNEQLLRELARLLGLFAIVFLIKTATRGTLYTNLQINNVIWGAFCSSAVFLWIARRDRFQISYILSFAVWTGVYFFFRYELHWWCKQLDGNDRLMTFFLFVLLPHLLALPTRNERLQKALGNYAIIVGLTLAVFTLPLTKSTL